MKGAKGGKRDRFISENFRKRNQSAKEKELEAMKSHQKIDGFRFSDKKIEKQESKDKEEQQNILNEVQEEQENFVSFKQEETEEIKQEIEIEIVSPRSFIQDPLVDEKNTEDEEKNEVVEEDLTKKEEPPRKRKKAVGVDKQEQKPNYNYNIDYDENVNVKEEFPKEKIEEKKEEPEEFTKNEKLETEVLDEIDRMLKEDYYEIKDLEYQIQVLNSKEKEAVRLEEVEAIRKELENLLKRLEQLKDKYNAMKNSENFADITLLDNNYLAELLNEYKEQTKENMLVFDLVEKVKDASMYVSIMEKVILVEKEKDHLKEIVEEKKEDFEYRDTNFEQIEKEYNNVEKINQEIEKFNFNMEQILKSIAGKVDKMGKITEKVEQKTRWVTDMNRFFLAIGQFALASRIPRNRRGNLVRTMIIVGAFADLNRVVTRKEATEMKRSASYIDYSSEISASISDLSTYMYQVDQAFTSIDEIRNLIKRELGEYVDSVPEFQDLMKNVDNTEKQLEEQKYYLEKYNYEAKRELERNNAKVLIYKNV